MPPYTKVLENQKIFGMPKSFAFLACGVCKNMSFCDAQKFRRIFGHRKFDKFPCAEKENSSVT